MAPLPTKTVALACVISVFVWFRIFRTAKIENPFSRSFFAPKPHAKASTQARVAQTLYTVNVLMKLGIIDLVHSGYTDGIP